ncbi:MAG TPA: endonuclease/exonuclease/phosphatase family protein [Myxococcaceae bacterium]|nr:endonuclease/exonuclease/phosphatase family protein [Myxococcaceae bacterium]
MRGVWVSALSCVFLGAACELPARTDWDERSRVAIRERREKIAVPPDPSRLRILAWNIKFGAGRIDFWFDFWGDRAQMTPGEVTANMEGIYALLREVDADVLLISEIEVGSRRSAYYDMVAGILENAGLNYAAFFPTWESRYVPSEGVGRLEMGNAIFSRYPIVLAERIAQAEREDLSAERWYFYLHRNIGRAVLDLVDRQVAAYVVHTEAYDSDRTKSKHLQHILEELRGEELRFVVGGDFNAIPPNAARDEKFPDEHPSSLDTEFENPPYVLTDMEPFFAEFVPAIPLERMGSTETSQRRYYTHSVIGPATLGTDGQTGFWNRTLDYLFVRAPDGWDASTTDVLQTRGDSGIESDPLLLSDHAPVVGSWVLAP